MVPICQEWRGGQRVSCAAAQVPGAIRAPGSAAGGKASPRCEQAWSFRNLGCRGLVERPLPNGPAAGPMQRGRPGEGLQSAARSHAKERCVYLYHCVTRECDDRWCSRLACEVLSRFESFDVFAVVPSKDLGLGARVSFS